MLKLSEYALPFLRHIRHCNNIALPSDRIPLFFQHSLIGYVVPELVPTLQEESFSPFLSFVSGSDKKCPASPRILLHKGENLRVISKMIEEKNLFKPFNEWFDIRLPQEHFANEGKIIGQIDRALIPLLGTEAEGVHLNGLVHKENETFLWVAKRSKTKRLDPGKHDHLVAGGICSGFSPKETLIKEALEEAQLDKNYTKQAKKTALISYAMLRPEGLRRDKLHCYDLVLPETFKPYAADGEVETFSLMPLKEIFKEVRDTDNFKFNVNLVLIDLFIRHNFFNEEDSYLLHKALFSSPSCIEEKKTT